MQLIIEDSAHDSIEDIYDYLFYYSYSNAVAIIEEIYEKIYDLEYSPYLGRYILEMGDKRFRELIYRRNRYSGYRIMYYISENLDTIYIIGIINCKQDFNRYLKRHGYFKKYYNL